MSILECKGGKGVSELVLTREALIGDCWRAFLGYGGGTNDAVKSSAETASTDWALRRPDLPVVDGNTGAGARAGGSWSTPAVWAECLRLRFTAAI